ncbi:conserved hypothetical protein (plasmid) [Lysinibacillus sphaericus C3-41]|nr:conserved hypothetical protein [Lysinibacillus sphaericus C3-41]
MNHMEKEQVKGYSIQEITELLGVVEMTVYQYIKKGLLEEVDQPNLKYTINGQRLFTVESVEALKDKMTVGKDYISLNAYAKQNGINQIVLKKLIAENDIDIPKGTQGLREVFLITPDIKAQLDKLVLENSFTHFKTKSKYYNSKYDIALLQSFVDTEGKAFRIVKNGAKWGVYEETGFTQFECLDGLKPLYSIHKPTVNALSMYVYFKIPNEDKNRYNYVDAIYATFGIENAQLLLTDTQIAVRVKVSSWSMSEDDKHLENLLTLNQYASNGELIYIDNILSVESTDKRVVVILPKDIHSKLSKHAKDQKITDSKAAQQIILDYFENR